MGYKVVNFFFDEKLPPDLDLIFAYGPYGSFVPLVRQLLSRPRDQRPPLVLHHAEQFPNPDFPEWFRYSLGSARTALERLAYYQDASGCWRVRPALRQITRKAYRFRYYGDIFWLRQTGVLTLLSFVTPWTAEYMRARGFNTFSTDGMGYPMKPEWGAELHLERDVPVLWLGTIASKRRAQLLQRIRAELSARGVDIRVIDGVAHPMG
jgi:hypothetical protein